MPVISTIAKPTHATAINIARRIRFKSCDDHSARQVAFGVPVKPRFLRPAFCIDASSKPSCYHDAMKTLAFLERFMPLWRNLKEHMNGKAGRKSTRKIRAA